MSEWKPIETAPDDIGPVLVIDTMGDVSVAEKNERDWVCLVEGTYALDPWGDFVRCIPTHWMPLPEPPA